LIIARSRTALGHGTTRPTVLRPFGSGKFRRCTSSQSLNSGCCRQFRRPGWRAPTQGARAGFKHWDYSQGGGSPADAGGSWPRVPHEPLPPVPPSQSPRSPQPSLRQTPKRSPSAPALRAQRLSRCRAEDVGLARRPESSGRLSAGNCCGTRRETVPGFLPSRCAGLTSRQRVK